MVNSRNINDLHPKVAALCSEMVNRCKNAGIDLLITSTYRDAESQNALYAQGRATDGKIVTNAKAGQSYHNWKVAFDVVPLRYGKPVWGTKGDDLKLWEQVGAIGESLGLEWAWRWTRNKEMAHFQFTDGLKIADFQAGKTL